MIFEKFLAKRKVKLFLISLIIGMCVTSVLSVYSKDIVEGISDSVVRLHVVANSRISFFLMTKQYFCMYVYKAFVTFV